MEEMRQFVYKKKREYLQNKSQKANNDSKL